MNRQNAAILIFDEVEVLDFAGPFEVLSRTRLTPGVESRRSEQSAPFNVFTVAHTAEPVQAVGGLRVIPQCAFTAAPHIDILVVPGGFGIRPLMQHEPTLNWIRQISATAGQLASVCTGSLLLARAGLLKNRRATTHGSALDALAEVDPTITVERSSRVVEDGVMTSAGVAAGIDMAFALVERLHGRAVADETAHYIEYSRSAPAQ